MPEQDQYSKRIAELSKLTHSCVSRWDITFNIDGPADNVGMRIRLALRKAAQKAMTFEFSPPYADDHSMTVSGMPGVSQRRIKEIAEDPYAISSDIYGVMVVAHFNGAGVAIPIVTDLDESSSEGIMNIVGADVASYVDADLVSQLLESSQFELTVISGNWKTLARAIESSLLGLEDALLFRAVGAWDLIRGALSGLPLSKLPAFSDTDFASRYFRSMRFSPSEIESSKVMLEAVIDREHEFLSPKWTSWFETMVETLNLVGPAKTFDGLSVVISFAYEEVAKDEPWDWHPLSVHNMVVGCGLDPVSAFNLHEVVRHNPTLFHQLPRTDLSRYRAGGVMIIPDVHLALHRVSTVGRVDEAYGRLVASTAEA